MRRIVPFDPVDLGVDEPEAVALDRRPLRDHSREERGGDARPLEEGELDRTVRPGPGRGDRRVGGEREVRLGAAQAGEALRSSAEAIEGWAAESNCQRGSL